MTASLFLVRTVPEKQAIKGQVVGCQWENANCPVRTHFGSAEQLQPFVDLYVMRLGHESNASIQTQEGLILSIQL